MGASTVARMVTSLEIAEHLRRWTEVVVAHHSDVLDPEKIPTEVVVEVAVAMVALPHVAVVVVPSMVKAGKEVAAGAVVPLPAMVEVGVGEVALADDDTLE